MVENGFKLEPLLNVRTGKVVAYEVLYRGFQRDTEKAFVSIDEEWDYEIFLSNVTGLRRIYEEGKLPSPYKFILNIKPSTLLTFLVSVLSLIEDLPFVVILELREDWIREKELRELATARQEKNFLLSVDDFGRGASNFDRLFYLQPDLLKIDFGVVENVPFSSLLHLVESIKTLGISVNLVAERIETQELARKAKALGIELLQGFWVENFLKGDGYRVENEKIR